MVTYGWGIFIVFMVSILLLAAIGMLYLLRSLYPFSSKYEIACVIACGIVMILAVLFSVYGVKKLACTERQVETQHETEVAIRVNNGDRDRAGGKDRQQEYS